MNFICNAYDIVFWQQNKYTVIDGGIYFLLYV